MSTASVAIIGAGLAGSEAALVLAGSGISVTLFEMRPRKTTPAHTSALPAELVCSNSLKSNELPTAQGLLKTELRLLASPLLTCAHGAAVKAGSALAVDRRIFSENVAAQFAGCATLKVVRKEITELPLGYDAVILATGPLTSPALADWIARAFSLSSLYFYDAIGPIVAADSIDWNTAFLGSRWKENEDDYCNCPFTQEQYDAFRNALIAAEKTPIREFEEEKYFEACLPIEVIASRGYEAMAYGPLKPIGLPNPKTNAWAFAIAQLRRENASADCYSLVAFQTRLTIAEQKRVFRMIPGLQNAEFVRYGSCHRNTFIDSPTLLSPDLSFKAMPNVFCAGQLCGNEGYVESIATGHCAARMLVSRLQNKESVPPPAETALGAIMKQVTSSPIRPFTPSSFHFGLLPPLPPTGARRKIPKKEKQQMQCDRALQSCKSWITASIVR